MTATFNYRNVEGLTQCGSTDQTNLIAAACRTDMDIRKELVTALLAMDAEVTYSNQDGDRQRALANALANAARSGCSVYSSITKARAE